MKPVEFGGVPPTNQGRNNGGKGGLGLVEEESEREKCGSRAAFRSRVGHAK
jgi:hypothetical protein